MVDDGLLLRDILFSAPAPPEHDALVFPDKRFTYADIRKGAYEKARALFALGVRRGDHVGILMPNSPDFVFTFWATQLLGAIAVPINTRLRSHELRYVIPHADITVLVTTDLIREHVSFSDRLEKAFPELANSDRRNPLQLSSAPRLRHIVLNDSGPDAPPAMVSGEKFSALSYEVDDGHVTQEGEGVTPDDPALILFTSGTTAHPKGCLLTHRGIIAVWCSMGERIGITQRERVFDPLPMFHMSCIGPMIFTFAAGATLQTMVHFEANAALDMIETERSTWLYTMFPTITMDLIRHPSFPQRDLSHVRALGNTGPAETLRIMQDAFPHAVQIPGPFGMTEASGAITCEEPSAPLERRLTTTGHPLPNTEVKVVCPSGDPMPVGEKGELLVRGVGIMKGYYRDPEATEKVIDADGWMRTGDLGYLEPDGRVVYVGRLKDMLKVGGENVAASEVEAHLSTHPAIKLAQVIGAPDERLGEVPVAFVEIAPGHQLTEDEVIAYCREELASFKVPRKVYFLTEWPTSATKIQKFKLYELLEGGK